MAPPTVGPSVPASLDTETGEGAAAAGIARAGSELAQFGLKALAKLKDAKDTVQISAMRRKYDEMKNAALLSAQKAEDQETADQIWEKFQGDVQGMVETDAKNGTQLAAIQQYHDRIKPQTKVQIDFLMLKKQVENLRIGAMVEIENLQAQDTPESHARQAELYQKLVKSGAMRTEEAKRLIGEIGFTTKVRSIQVGNAATPGLALQGLASIAPEDAGELQVLNRAMGEARGRASMMATKKDSDSQAVLRKAAEAIDEGTPVTTSWWEENDPTNSVPVSSRTTMEDRSASKLKRAWAEVFAKEELAALESGNQNEYKHLQVTAVEMEIQGKPVALKKIEEYPVASKLAQAERAIDEGNIAEAKSILVGIDSETATTDQLKQIKKMQADADDAAAGNKNKMLSGLIMDMAENQGQPKTRKSLLAKSYTRRARAESDKGNLTMEQAATIGKMIGEFVAGKIRITDVETEVVLSDDIIALNAMSENPAQVKRDINDAYLADKLSDASYRTLMKMASTQIADNRAAVIQRLAKDYETDLFGTSAASAAQMKIVMALGGGVPNISMLLWKYVANEKPDATGRDLNIKYEQIRIEFPPSEVGNIRKELVKPPDDSVLPVPADGKFIEGRKYSNERGEVRVYRNGKWAKE